jgi:CheY-like chemotaxis protein
MSRGIRQAGPGMRILLVDDDPDVREYTALVLEDAGYAVRVAARADEAETILGTGEPFDLLITDIVMPGRDGVMLAQLLHRMRPGVKVLFTTGYTRHIAPELLAESEILEKPYHRAALLHAVRHVRGATTTRAPAEVAAPRGAADGPRPAASLDPHRAAAGHAKVGCGRNSMNYYAI